MTQTPEAPDARPTGYDRLAAIDPERGTPSPDLTDRREHLLALVSDVPHRRRGLRVGVAAAAAVAVVAGSLGAVAVNASRDQRSSTQAAGESVSPVYELVSLTTSSDRPGSGPGIVRAGFGADALYAVVAADSMQFSTTMDSGQALSGEAAGAMTFSAGAGVDDVSLGSAKAYVVDSAGVDRRAVASQLARYFGLDAQPYQLGTQILVGPRRNPRVTVGSYSDTWRYVDPSVSPQRYFHLRGNRKIRDMSPVDASTLASAQRQARQLLTAMGAPIDDVRWSTVNGRGGAVIYAVQTLDGWPSPLLWKFTVSLGGLYDAWGPLSHLVQTTDYPVISAQAAVERTADSRFASLGPTLYCGLEGACDLVLIADSELTLSDAWPMLVPYRQRSGKVLMLPGYRYTDEHGRGWQIVAVADSAVDFARD